MRTLLTTTALVALFSMGAVAQEAGTAGTSDLLEQGYQLVDTDGLASRLLGFPVYNAATTTPSSSARSTTSSSAKTARSRP